jgi:hypothetical protein
LASAIDFADGIHDCSTPNCLSTVHLILQGKGGVGKSIIATLLVQYLIGGDVF